MAITRPAHDSCRVCPPSRLLLFSPHHFRCLLFFPDKKPLVSHPDFPAGGFACPDEARPLPVKYYQTHFMKTIAGPRSA
jgi:hypothetical protein